MRQDLWRAITRSLLLKRSGAGPRSLHKIKPTGRDLDGILKLPPWASLLDFDASVGPKFISLRPTPR